MAIEQREFWSRVARRYDLVVDLQIGAKTRALVRERVTRGTRLGTLGEFGCGTGFYTEILATKADSVVATDLSSGMLALAKERITAPNVTFREENCQKSSFPNESFDTTFISFVLHFTEPDKTLAEMHRILKPNGKLIIVNLDPRALKFPDRIRCVIRILYHGLTRYRIKPPKGFGNNVITEKELCALLVQRGFKVVGTEVIRDRSRSSNIPVEYITAVKV